MRSERGYAFYDNPDDEGALIRIFSTNLITSEPGYAFFTKILLTSERGNTRFFYDNSDDEIFSTILMRSERSYNNSDDE